MSQNSSWSGGFTVTISVVGWVSRAVLTMNLGQANAQIANIWNARIISSSNTTYTLELAPYTSDHFAFTGTLPVGARFEGIPSFTCDDSQFAVPYCPHLVWRVHNLWPGGAHVQADLSPWVPNGVLRLSFPASTVVRHMWNARIYPTAPDPHNRTTVKLATYETSNWGAILDAIPEGGLVNATDVASQPYCGNLTVVPPDASLLRSIEATTVGLQLRGAQKLGEEVLQDLALTIARALEVSADGVQVLSEYAVRATAEDVTSEEEQVHCMHTHMTSAHTFSHHAPSLCGRCNCHARRQLMAQPALSHRTRRRTTWTCTWCSH